MKDFFKAFFSGLSENEKKVFIAASVLVGFALFDRVVIGPITKETSVLKDKISSQSAQIRSNLQILGHKDSIMDKYVLYGKYYAKDEQTQEERIAEMLNEVEGFAKASNIALTNINPVVVEDKGLYAIYRLTVECSGSMNNFVDFVYGVDNSKKLLRTVSYTIAPKDRDTYEVKATLTVIKMIIFPFDKNFFT
jgi:Tfp pilus assembly protein PilO